MILRQVRRLGAAALIGAFGLAGATQAASDFPNKSVRVVIPFPAGGGTDIIGRLVGKGLQEAWGQTVVVDNVAGAGGQIGGSQVARATPDGYTAMVGITSLIQQPALYKNLPYDAFKDFQPISILGYSSDLLMVPADSPVNSVDDLIKAAKARPGQLSLGSYGTGTSSHLHVELFKHLNGVDMVHVPYKGAAPEVVDLMGGQLHAAFVDVTSASPHLKSGKIKVLAVTGGSRVSIAPEAPTLKELGQNGFEANGWFAFFLPANTPKPVVDEYAQEVMRIVKTPEMIERLQSMSLRPGGTTPEETAQIMMRDGKGWASIVERANVKLD